MTTAPPDFDPPLLSPTVELLNLHEHMDRTVAAVQTLPEADQSGAYRLISHYLDVFRRALLDRTGRKHS
ncbi:MAG TPA: hypothetical protein VHA75_13400 [Rugosimonospora sp.]|nr:hypothetical protein [Rugosimonospora sp.]